jgi:hypothetical protein
MNSGSIQPPGPAMGSQAAAWVIAGGAVTVVLGAIGFAVSGLRGAVTTIAIYGLAPAALGALCSEACERFERRRRRPPAR